MQAIAPLARPAFLALLVAALAAACSAPKPPDEGDYATEVIRARVEKDEYLRTSPDSPMTDSGKKSFLPLEYYDVNPTYKVPAALTPSDDTASIIMIPTSAGTQDPFRKVGTLEFTLGGQTLKLTAYAPAAARTLDRLFVPFKDLTNGDATYGGGRYLDLDRTATGLYEMDFNLAYTPNCHYNPTWICPLPPRENHLPVAVEAGEKVKKEHAAN